VELQESLEELRAQGLGLAAVSYDSKEVLAEFARRYAITFPLLSDVGSATITAYGILNTIAQEGLDSSGDDADLAEAVRKYVAIAGTNPMFLGTPFPGYFIVDRDRRVKARFFEEFYRERSTVSSVLVRMGADVAVPGTRVATEHLTLTTYASDAAVAPGHRFALVLNVEPRPGIHVYAPGAAGYRVITLNMAEQPFVRVLPMQYPPSEIYFFEPLNERVRVYQKPFTLVQELVLDATQEAERALKEQETLALGAAFEYQACDDKICFNPVSVPLSWTITLKRHVTGRITPRQK